MINDGQARRIASEFHGGQGSALYMLASTGATRDGRFTFGDTLRAVERELLPHRVADYDAMWPGTGAELRALYAYVREAGPRGPVPNWADVWCEDRVTA